MQRITLSSLILVSVLLFAGTALAQGMMRQGGQGGPGGPGPGYGYGMTQEQWQAMNQLRQEQLKEIMPLQQELWAKDAELGTLLDQPEPDQAKVDKLTSEIANLRGEIYKKQIAYRQKAAKQGVPMGYGGYGGMGGPGMMGPGSGYGMMGGGWGSCPYTGGY